MQESHCIYSKKISLINSLLISPQQFSSRDACVGGRVQCGPKQSGLCQGGHRMIWFGVSGV